MRIVTEERRATANEVLRVLIRESGVGQEAIAKAMGYPDRRYVAAKLNSKNMTVDAVVGIAECLGYELVLQRKAPGKRKEGQVVIERQSEE